MSVEDGGGAAMKQHGISEIDGPAAVRGRRTHEAADQETRELTKEQRRHEHEQLFAAQVLQYDAAGHGFRTISARRWNGGTRLKKNKRRPKGHDRKQQRRPNGHDRKRRRRTVYVITGQTTRRVARLVDDDRRSHCVYIGAVTDR